MAEPREELQTIGGLLLREELQTIGGLLLMVVMLIAWLVWGGRVEPVY